MCQYICEYDVITDLIPPPKPSGSNKYNSREAWEVLGVAGPTAHTTDST